MLYLTTHTVTRDLIKGFQKSWVYIIFTARKLSLGQGNVFAGVFLSTWGGGVGFPACITDYMTTGSASKGVCIWEGSTSMGVYPPTVGSAYGGLGRPLKTQDTWDTMGYGQQAGSTHPTGMHSCL